MSNPNKFIDKEFKSLQDGAGKTVRRKSKLKPAIDLSSDSVLGIDAPAKGTRGSEKKKPRSSVCAVTINLNKPYDGLSADEKARFKQFADYLFDKRNIVKYLTDQTNPSDPKKNIDNLQLDYNFEVGRLHGLLHLHGLIRIQHHGFYRLRLNDIREVARRMFGHAIHLNAPVSGDPIAAWQAYMKKGVHSV